MVTRSSTDTKQVPWSSGLGDYNTGLVENAVVYRTKDALLGDIKYLGQRPSFTFIETLINGFTSGTVGSTLSVVSSSSGESFLATTENIFYNIPSVPGGATPILSGTDLSAWEDLMEDSGHSVPPVPYQNNSTSDNFVAYLDAHNDFIFLVNTLTHAPTASSLAFEVNQYAVGMDGYMFVAEAGSDTIYNSDVNDPFTYNLAVNKIRASQVPGNIVALYRTGPYIVAFKEASIEFFYNAGLTNTSPLQRNASLLKRIGCASPNTIAVNSETLYFAGRYNGLGDVKIFSMAGTEAREISTPLVEQHLRENFTLSSDGTRLLQAYVARINGKEFYILTNTASPEDSLVYDIDLDEWVSWGTSPLPNGGVPIQTCLSIVFPTASTESSTGPLSGSDFGYYYMNRTVFDPTNPNTDIYYSDYNLQFTTKDYIKVESVTEYSDILVVLKLPTSNYGSGDRKFLRKISVASQTPPDTEHSVTFSRLVGYDRQSNTQTTLNSENTTFHNFGSFVYGDIIYTWRDPSPSTEPGVEAKYVRFDGVEMALTKGRS